MRYVKIIIVVIVGCLFFASFRMVVIGQYKYFGFKASAFTIIDEYDTHGGFHGDGTYYLVLDCSENTAQAMELNKEWKPLPFTENLQIIMYGGEKNGVSYGYNLAEEAHWPVIHNGVYKFVDRHSEAIDKADDTNLFNRHSFNFSIAVYDLDTDTLYYFEFDT